MLNKIGAGTQHPIRPHWMLRSSPQSYNNSQQQAARQAPQGKHNNNNSEHHSKRHRANRTTTEIHGVVRPTQTGRLRSPLKFERRCELASLEPFVIML